MTSVTTTATECPTCGKNGKPVSPTTLRALLKDEFVGRVAETEYRFCDAKDCDSVYHGNGQTFTTAELNVAVGVKESCGERPLCYCFGHSVGTITAELRTKGRSDALDTIRRKMKDPGCACEVTNPSDSCCLGTVAKPLCASKEDEPAHQKIAVDLRATKITSPPSPIPRTSSTRNYWNCVGRSIPKRSMRRRQRRR